MRKRKVHIVLYGTDWYCACGKELPGYFRLHNWGRIPVVPVKDRCKRCLAAIKRKRKETPAC